MTSPRSSRCSTASALASSSPIRAMMPQRAIDAAAASGAVPVIPRRTTTATRRPFDAALYKERNLVERFFSKIKHFRRVATRYDKLARNYRSFIFLVAALKWLA